MLLYCYNPFRAPVLRNLLAALVKQRQQDAADLDFLYLYPEEEKVFIEFPAFTHVWREEIPLADDESPDGLSSHTDPCSLYRLAGSHSLRGTKVAE